MGKFGESEKPRDPYAFLRAINKAERRGDYKRKRLSRKDRTLRRQYGITLEQYDTKVKMQGGKCAICNLDPGRHPLHVDHDHATGKVRDLLCPKCNVLLGLATERVALLRAAADYLERHTLSEPT